MDICDKNLVGKKVMLRPTHRNDVKQIIRFELENKDFVHFYSKEKHLELLDDTNCLHLSVFRRDVNELIGHVILFGLQTGRKVLEFRRITITQPGNGYGRETLILIQKMCFETLLFESIWLDVYDDNSLAIHLYESEGFSFSSMLYADISQTKNGRNQRIYKMTKKDYFAKKKQVEYQEKIPTAHTYWKLFNQTGWNDDYGFTKDDLYEAIQNSWYVVSAFVENELVGFGRVISDGLHHALIVDMIVAREYQRKGIGKDILTRLVTKCEANKIRDIQLFAANGKVGFYEKNGFERRPSNAPGMQYSMPKSDNI